MKITIDLPEKYLKVAFSILSVMDEGDNESILVEAFEKCKDSNVPLAVEDLGPESKQLVTALGMTVLSKTALEIEESKETK